MAPLYHFPSNAPYSKGVGPLAEGFHSTMEARGDIATVLRVLRNPKVRRHAHLIAQQTPAERLKTRKIHERGKKDIIEGGKRGAGRKTRSRTSLKMRKSAEQTTADDMSPVGSDLGGYDGEYGHEYGGGLDDTLHRAFDGGHDFAQALAGTTPFSLSTPAIQFAPSDLPPPPNLAALYASHQAPASSATTTDSALRLPTPPPLPVLRPAATEFDTPIPDARTPAPASFAAAAAHPSSATSPLPLPLDSLPSTAPAPAPTPARGPVFGWWPLGTRPAGVVAPAAPAVTPDSAAAHEPMPAPVGVAATAAAAPSLLSVPKKLKPRKKGESAAKPPADSGPPGADYTDLLTRFTTLAPAPGSGVAGTSSSSSSSAHVLPQQAPLFAPDSQATSRSRTPDAAASSTEAQSSSSQQGSAHHGSAHQSTAFQGSTLDGSAHRDSAHCDSALGAVQPAPFATGYHSPPRLEPRRAAPFEAGYEPPPRLGAPHVDAPRAEPPRLSSPRLDPPRLGPTRLGSLLVDPPHVYTPPADGPRLGTSRLGALRVVPPRVQPPRRDAPPPDPPRLDAPRLDPPSLDAPRLDAPRLDRRLDPRLDPFRLGPPLLDPPRAESPLADPPRRDASAYLAAVRPLGAVPPPTVVDVDERQPARAPRRDPAAFLDLTTFASDNSDSSSSSPLSRSTPVLQRQPLAPRQQQDAVEAEERGEAVKRWAEDQAMRPSGSSVDDDERSAHGQHDVDMQEGFDEQGGEREATASEAGEEQVVERDLGGGAWQHDDEGSPSTDGLQPDLSMHDDDEIDQLAEQAQDEEEQQKEVEQKVEVPSIALFGRTAAARAAALERKRRLTELRDVIVGGGEAQRAEQEEEKEAKEAEAEQRDALDPVWVGPSVAKLCGRMERRREKESRSMGIRPPPRSSFRRPFSTPRAADHSPSLSPAVADPPRAPPTPSTSSSPSAAQGRKRTALDDAEPSPRRSGPSSSSSSPAPLAVAALPPLAPPALASTSPSVPRTAARPGPWSAKLRIPSSGPGPDQELVEELAAVLARRRALHP
ncbi:hypothetical protein JCM9279_005860 [Rhodotorula babjevae]